MHVFSFSEKNEIHALDGSKFIQPIYFRYNMGNHPQVARKEI